jgi:hypothetical protein
MDGTVFTLLERKLAERKRDIEGYLAGGNVASYEEYCRFVGEYRGLVDIEAEVKELERRYIED